MISDNVYKVFGDFIFLENRDLIFSHKDLVRFRAWFLLELRKSVQFSFCDLAVSTRSVSGRALFYINT